jgi:hypothetical protein
MSFSMPCSRNRIRPDWAGVILTVLTGLAVAAALDAAAGPVTAAGMPAAAPPQRPDYFTELEIDDIRNAQEIGPRTDVLLEIATRRLAALGLVEGHGDDPSGDSGLGGKIGRVFIRIFSPETADVVAAEEEQRARLAHDLSSHTPIDLLRGYYQALEETMDNIDDAYERGRGDVTGPLEELRDFTGEALPLLEAMEVSTYESDESDDTQRDADAVAEAIEDAIEQSHVAHDGAVTSLETLRR